MVSVLVTRPMTGWSAAKAADDAARDMAAMARMERELNMVCLRTFVGGRQAPAGLDNRQRPLCGRSAAAGRRETIGERSD
ncbi:hypothetical protein GmRootV11_32400 [Variovorax sp. V11]